MGRFFFTLIAAAVAALFTGLGIYSWRREKPMWFWSGTTVSEEEISDVHAYNRANGIMWIVFSALFWISAALGLMQAKTGGIVMIVGCFVGLPALVIAYGKIYAKYKAQK